MVYVDSFENHLPRPFAHRPSCSGQALRNSVTYLGHFQRSTGVSQSGASGIQTGEPHCVVSRYYPGGQESKE